MPEAMGGLEYGSIVAPYIGAVFEGSRILRKVTDIRTGVPEVPVCKVEDSDDRQLWAFRNIHAYSEYTSPITVHWYQAAQDWVLDIRTASSAGKIAPADPTDPDKKRRIPLDSDERKGAVESEKLMKAMIAVTASARAMDTSAGVMDKYVEALVGGDADRADTWREFLVHDKTGEEKIEKLLDNPAIKHYYDKLKRDAYKRDASGNLIEPNLDSQLIKFLEKKDDYKGGFREYVYDFLLEKTEEEIETLSRTLGYELIKDSEVRTAAVKLAADIFLVDKYTKWEYDVENEYANLHLKDADPAKRKIQLKPTENWGGNPLRMVIEPSFLPRTIKKVYKQDEQILDWVDDAFTFDFEIPSNLSKEKREELEQLKANFKEKCPKPSMTSRLKDLNRYGQALMTLFGGSTAPSLPVLNDHVFSGKESITNIWELMNQVVGDVEGKKDEQWPFGKDVMGWFTARILYIKSVAAVRQFMSPGTLTFTFSADDQRNLRKVAETIFGTRLKGEVGVLRETASGRLGFKYKTNRIPGIAELIEQTKNNLLLGGEHGKEAAYLKRFFQATFGVAAAVSGGGGRRK